MKILIGELRRIIRRVLSEEPGITVDPTEVKGFYPWEIERGTDIHDFWYKSPGRSVGSDGDPGRPADAADYIGMKVNSPDESSMSTNVEESK
jgi:hypothetical protein